MFRNAAEDFAGAVPPNVTSATFQGPFGLFSVGRFYAEAMDPDNTAWTRISGCFAGVTYGLSRRNALLIICLFTVGLLWVVAVAPALVSFAITVALAAAWCAWLQKHPEPPLDAGRSADDGHASFAPQVDPTGSVVIAAACLTVLTTAAHGQTAIGGTAFHASAPPQEAAASTPQEPNPWRNVKFGGTFEGYYQYNWNRTPDRTLVLRAYDTRSNTFGIQQAALVVDAAPDVDARRRYGLRLDLQFGQATETVQGNPANEPRPDVYRHVWQAYGTYLFPVGANGLQADFGKFASMLGYETNYAKDNQAFSRAYLFNFLPFYHSGLRLALPVNDKVSLLYMLTNGIQQTEEFNDFKSNHVAAILKPASMATWTVNYYFGQEQSDGGEPGGPDGFFRVFDTYVTVTPTAALTLGADVNYTTNEVNTEDSALSLQGLGTYARYQVTSAGALGLRYERLDDEGLFGGIDQVLHEATLTGEYKLVDGFLVRAEYRRDSSNEPFFPGRRGASDLRGHQNTVLIGGIWWFGNKSGAW
jgi:hypothetical protein